MVHFVSQGEEEVQVCGTVRDLILVAAKKKKHAVSVWPGVVLSGKIVTGAHRSKKHTHTTVFTFIHKRAQ